MFQFDRIITLTVTWVCLFGSVLVAQDDDAPKQKSELGVRQKLIQLKMLEVEKKFTVIADRLRESQPKQAELLVEAYQKSKEQLIVSKMELVSDQLDKNQFAEARQNLNEIDRSLDALVGLLTQRKDKSISKEKEMEQLQKWKKQIEQQIKDQKKNRSETEKVSNKDETIKKLEASIKKLEGLIQKQQVLVKKTAESKGAPLRDLDRVADQQFEIRKATNDLNKELGEIGDADNKTRRQQTRRQQTRR